MKKNYLMFLLVMLPAFILAQNVYYLDDVETNGDGSLESPWNDLPSIMGMLNPGDVLNVMPGTHVLSGSVFTKKDGTAENPITIQAYDMEDKPIITRDGDYRLFRCNKSYHVLDGLILDGDFRNDNIMTLDVGSDGWTIKNCEVRYSLKDAIVMNTVRDITIDNCHIHHILRKENGKRFDAHGILGYHQRNLRITNTEISHTSGDCVQSDPSFEAPGWDSVYIENCHLWTGPLDKDYAEYAKGEIPGENAVDFKTMTEEITPEGYKPVVHMKNVLAGGWIYDPVGYGSDRPCYNIKHNINAILENCIAYDSDIGFRLRGPYTWDDDGTPRNFGGVHLTMFNCISYNNHIAVWLERNIEVANIYNCTFDITADGTYIDKDTEFVEEGLDMKNCIFVNEFPSFFADNYPSLEIHASNMAIAADQFWNRDNYNYRLMAGSDAIGAGVDIEIASKDFLGNTRPAGNYDIGAFQFDANYTSTEDLNVDDSWVSVSPNPVIDNAILKFSTGSFETNIKIYSLTGQLVKSVEPRSSMDEVLIDFSDFRVGIYLIRVSVPEKSQTLRVIKL